MLDRAIRIKQTRLYFAETIMGLMLLIAVNLVFFPLRPAFYDIHPSPYWIVILAISARYGRRGGIFAGVASAIVFIGYHVIVDNGIKIFFDDPWLLIHPFLFFLIGFLIGEVKTAYLLREDFLTRRIEELETKNSQTSKELDILKQAHRNLTTNVATTQETMTVLSQISDRLKSLKPDEIYNGILDCFNQYIGAEECSIYVKEGEDLILKYSSGWMDYYRRPEKYRIGKGLIGKVAAQKKSFTIKDVVFRKIKDDAEQPDMLGDTVLAMPILDVMNEPYGVASIEKIEFLKLTESAIQEARVICELAAASLNNAYSFAAAEKEQIRERDIDLFKYHYFVSRVNEEYLRSINYMIPLSAMSFCWPALAKAPEKRRPFMESVIKIIKTHLRAFDVLATGPSNEIPLVLLLATTPGAQASEMKGKIIEKIAEYKLDTIITRGNLAETILVGDYNPRKIKNVHEFFAQIGIES